MILASFTLLSIAYVNVILNIILNTSLVVYFHFTNSNMKFSFFFKLFTIILLITIPIITIYNNTFKLLICEPYAPYVYDNFFFKIEELNKGVWNVLFKNVDACYEVTSSDRTHLGDFKNQNFRMEQVDSIPGDLESVDHVRINNNILDAVLDHFNDIQRGNFHTYSPNHINPNSHGKYMGFIADNSINSPLDQFFIKEFITFFFNLGGNFKLLFTNMALYLSIVTFIGYSLNVIYNKLDGLVSNFWSLNKESIYATIHGIVINQISMVKGQNFMPLIFTLFIFIFISNLIGMVPYSFSPTSHFILTFFISFTIVIGSTLLGFSLYKSKFFSILVPSGCPTALLPLLVLIEFISYLARNVSLGLRLAANILSGHMLLNILSGFTYNIMASGFIIFFIGLIPLVFITAFSTLEMGICFIQAQVFSVLSSSYIKDGTLLH